MGMKVFGNHFEFHCRCHGQRSSQQLRPHPGKSHGNYEKTGCAISMHGSYRGDVRRTGNGAHGGIPRIRTTRIDYIRERKCAVVTKGLASRCAGGNNFHPIHFQKLFGKSAQGHLLQIMKNTSPFSRYLTLETRLALSDLSPKEQTDLKVLRVIFSSFASPRNLRSKNCDLEESLAVLEAYAKTVLRSPFKDKMTVGELAKILFNKLKL